MSTIMLCFLLLSVPVQVIGCNDSFLKRSPPLCVDAADLTQLCYKPNVCCLFYSAGISTTHFGGSDGPCWTVAGVHADPSSCAT